MTTASNSIPPVTVAVAGNPNAGKSTLINAIAGSRLHVGNWPGVTVEKKTAVFKYHDTAIHLVDLPGTYSLSPYTQEEIVARDYLVEEKPQVIINVVDATNLERNLYLTVQLLELGIPVIIALNVYDEAQKKGLEIDLKGMETLLGVRVIPTVATREKGFDELLQATLATASGEMTPSPGKTQHYGDELETAINTVGEHLTTAYPALVQRYPRRWLALKLIEGDEQLREKLRLTDERELDKFLDTSLHHLRHDHDEDLESLLADTRYARASGLTKEVLRKPPIQQRDLTEKIDAVVLNRYLGIPIFLGAMWLMFKLTFDLSTPFVDWIDAMSAGPFRRWGEAAMTGLHAPDWTVSLVTDGVIAGVGFVLVFVPVIFAMMFFVTFLEGSGYMARAAFVMDRAMHAIGLHGKSFIPMLMGFGCNVPAIYATRTLENQRDKALTALLVPLMSCGARLPVYVLFTGIFFAANAGTVLWSLYTLGIALAVLMGLIFKNTLFRGEAPMFIMELPPYRLPSWRSLLIHTWEKGKHFLIKAGTYILAVSILVWFLLNLPWGVEERQDSLLGQAGQAVAPIFTPLGFGNWEAASALLTGIIAKEIVVGTMGEIYVAELPADEAATPPGVGEDLLTIGTTFLGAVREAGDNVLSTFGIASLATEEDPEAAGLRPIIRERFTPLSAYSFMVFVLLYMPCIIVAIAMRQELGTWKWFGIAVAYQSVLAWTVAMVIYQGGRLLGLGG